MCGWVFHIHLASDQIPNLTPPTLPTFPHPIAPSTPPTHLGLLDDGRRQEVVLHAQRLHVGDQGPGVEGGRLRVDGGGGDGKADGGAFLWVGWGGVRGSE